MPCLPVHHQVPELLKLMSIESVLPSNHLILCRLLLLSRAIFPSIRIFSNESALHIRWPKSSALLVVKPMPPLVTPQHSQASLTQSLVETLLISPGCCCVPDCFLCSPSVCFSNPVEEHYRKFYNDVPLVSKVIFPWGSHLLTSSMVGLMVTFSKMADATWCMTTGLLQSQPLSLQQATADLYLCRRQSNNQGQFWISFIGMFVSWCAQDFV